MTLCKFKVYNVLIWNTYIYNKIITIKLVNTSITSHSLEFILDTVASDLLSLICKSNHIISFLQGFSGIPLPLGSQNCPGHETRAQSGICPPHLLWCPKLSHWRVRQGAWLNLSVQLFVPVMHPFPYALCPTLESSKKTYLLS